MWTVSCLYFSCKDIDEIHGHQFRKTEMVQANFSYLESPSEFNSITGIHSMELKYTAGKLYYWINESTLRNTKSSKVKKNLSEAKAVAVANQNMIAGLEGSEVERITSTWNHHEYRGEPLPAFVISYKTPENIRAYLSVAEETSRLALV